MRGPGTVIGQDGTIVFVNHGGNMIKVHFSRIRPIDEFKKSTTGSETNSDHNVSDSDKPHDEYCAAGDVGHSVCIKDDVADASVSIQPDASVDEPVKNESDQTGEMTVMDETEDGRASQTAATETLPNISSGLIKRCSDLPKVKSIIRLHSSRHNQPLEAQIISRAGKATGKHKNWLNIQYLEPEKFKGHQEAVNFDTDVDHWEPIDKSSQLVFIEDVDRAQVSQADPYESAKNQEYNSWREYNVFEEVPDEGPHSIGVRWVLTTKSDQTRKARLVAKGYEDRDAPFFVKDSPTCSRESFRLLLCVASTMPQWTKCVALDVKTAFLQGKTLKRVIHIRPPPEFRKYGILWRLLKCVYGLSDASR